jgi:hypothetical protein
MIPEYLREAKEEIKWVEIKADNSETLRDERSIIHLISTSDLDRTRDVMNPKGMIDKEFEKSPSVWYNHNYRFSDTALPIGKSLWRKKKEDGVLAKTQFATTAFAEDVYLLHSESFMNTWSIGFRPARDKNGSVEKDSITVDEKTNITTWHKWDLLEYSSAPIAANPNARDMVKDLLVMNWKSELTDGMIKNIALEVEVKEQLEAMKLEIETLKHLSDEYGELLNRESITQKDIEELKQLINSKQEIITKQISIELPVNKMANKNFDSLVKSIVNGGR